MTVLQTPSILFGTLLWVCICWKKFCISLLHCCSRAHLFCIRRSIWWAWCTTRSSDAHCCILTSTRSSRGCVRFEINVTSVPQSNADGLLSPRGRRASGASTALKKHVALMRMDRCLGRIADLPPPPPFRCRDLPLCWTTAVWTTSVCRHVLDRNGTSMISLVIPPGDQVI